MRRLRSLERPEGKLADWEGGGTQKESYSQSEVVDVSCPFCGSRKETSCSSSAK